MGKDSWDRIRQRLSFAILCTSLTIAILGAVIGNISFFWHFSMYWNESEVHHEIGLGNGEFVSVKFTRSHFPADGKIWYTIERQNPVRELLHQRVTNSELDRWMGEPIGYTVERRTSFPGFEYTSGSFWPPTFWMHPDMPFVRMKISFLAVVLLAGFYPTIRLLSYCRGRRTSRRQSVGETLITEVTVHAHQQ